HYALNLIAQLLNIFAGLRRVVDIVSHGDHQSWHIYPFCGAAQQLSIAVDIPVIIEPSGESGTPELVYVYARLGIGKTRLAKWNIPNRRQMLMRESRIRVDRENIEWRLPETFECSRIKLIHQCRFRKAWLLEIQHVVVRTM